MLKELSNIPLSCIYAFIDHHNKLVYASHSSQSLVEIAKNVTDLKTNVHRSLDLQTVYNMGCVELEVLKGFSNDESHYIMRAEYSRLVADLETKGYRDLRPEYNAGEFKLKTQILTMAASPKPLYFVIAVSKRKEKLVLGIFDSIPVGKEWVALHFPNSDRIVPVFHDNGLTKAYHAEFGFKLNM